MDTIPPRPELLARTAEIVASFVGNNSVAVGDLPALITSVFGSADLLDAMHANILPRTFSAG